MFAWNIHQEVLTTACLCFTIPKVCILIANLHQLFIVLRQNNVSHMDLKPSNLLIKGSNPPILKVADFGFAQYLEENNKDRGLKGDNILYFNQTKF